MNAKQKMYQGVRVRVTVKEMLESMRAREANKKKLKLVTQACLDLQKLCSPTFPTPSGRLVDPPSVIQQPDASSWGPPAPQPLPAPYPLHDSLQIQASAFSGVQTHFGDGAVVPGVGYGGNNNNHPGGGVTYNPPLTPHTPSPQPWSQGLSPHADYYGMGCYSSSESLAPYNPKDYYSYSPQDSFSSSSSSSSCYSSPSRMESGQFGFTSEQYQYFNPQDGYSAPHCWLGQQESFPAAEYPPYDPPDYESACAMKEMNENYFRRDFP